MTDFNIPEKVLPHGQELIDNFVKNGSSWICSYRTLQIDLFDPTRCYSIFVPHLAVDSPITSGSYGSGLTMVSYIMPATIPLSNMRFDNRGQLQVEHNPPLTQPHRQCRTAQPQDAIKYYRETLHYLQKVMSYESYTTSLELVAIVLIISTCEMLDSLGGRGWERHFKGAFGIQRFQVIQRELNRLGAAVWWV
ncbi:hypothetical protein BJ878DRAFT_119790 [Calycina marina]|uniref:Uncharacterized protein n=1 Tax=Calycina marina TaxID=1763456 RepID=A0A9P7Z0L4_9HELO|nr:hypothetical protein BJ878DRAFT_119790 [Calycina marina]